MSRQVIDSETMKRPIFIHSLFRTGSTYLFHVFQRSDAGYWCYQEPLHEISLFAQDDNDLLLTWRGEKMKHLRHPGLRGSYFKELYEVANQCLDNLKKSSIYDAYFETSDSEFDAEFWKCLVGAARGRPVIQECRTSSRIGAIKKALGGFHIYLWRNPWDQWWSYKVTDYFDTTSQLIINASHHPEVVARLRQEICFEEYDSDDLSEQIDWFSDRRLRPEQTYLVFYVIWFLALREALAHADLLLSIDRLSDSSNFRQEITGTLLRNGIDGIDFSDCVIPQTRYAAEDREFFERVEDKAHGLFLLSGTTQVEIDEVQTYRRDHEPRIWNDGTREDHLELIRDAARARALVIKAESSSVKILERANAAESLNGVAEAEARQAEAKAQKAEAKAQKAEAKAQKAEAKAQKAEAKAQKAEAKAQKAEAKIQEAEDLLQAIYASRSWRISAPLRWLGLQLKLLRQHGPTARSKSFARKVGLLIVQRGIAFLSSKPALRYRLVSFATKIGLYESLRALYFRFSINSGFATPFRPEVQPFDANIALDQLTPRARRIYADLKAAIEKNKEVCG